MVVVDLVDWDLDSLQLVVGNYSVTAHLGSSYIEVFIEGGPIRDGLRVAYDRILSSLTGMTLLRYLKEDNRDALALLMTFSPILDRRDPWTTIFLGRLLGIPARTKYLPRKFEIKNDSAPRRAYDVVHNINRIREEFKKHPKDMAKYAPNVLSGARYLLKNFRMDPKVKKSLEELVATVVSSTL